MLIDLRNVGDRAYARIREHGVYKYGFDAFRQLNRVHEEICELSTVFRKGEGGRRSVKVDLSCEAEEIADAFIALSVYARARDINIEKAIKVKLDYIENSPMVAWTKEV